MHKQFFPHGRVWLINIVIVFALTGCATKQMTLTESGFLSSYADLKEEEDFGGMHVYMNPYADIAGQYDKILIAPVQFKLDPDVKEHEIKDENREELADYFVEALGKKLTDYYTVTDTPGEDVLLLRAAVTDILPNKVYLNLHWSTTLMGAGIGGASFEAELVDSLSNERMLSFVGARKGKRFNYTKGLTKWGHTKEVLGIWADQITEYLDQLKEESSAESP